MGWCGGSLANMIVIDFYVSDTLPGRPFPTQLLVTDRQLTRLINQRA